ncbi:precorrin-4 C(11)-methyltransferase [Marinifilum sp. N1E240]|uniref:precorrin-4 C(11)-methyltransferase n=1 Tax=Marinifilum sp. N1E240 TaxID=2608082 RepID=UPI00128BC8E4|nr:precorrin-4 C(11)-methyltransferase [Marinifilum sp. N1E240]MPQ49052.1 precorrin-4 C(11)-methyltransferase [Marinifilum sp. N1E240]
MSNTFIIINNRFAMATAERIASKMEGSSIVSVAGYAGSLKINSIQLFLQKEFLNSDLLIFIGAMGICVRSIAPYIQDKATDPAVINLDVKGKFVQSVLSGHKGGANEYAKQIAEIVNGTAIITTASDTLNLWPLDIIGKEYDWTNEYQNAKENDFISAFVNKRKTALLLNVKNEGTEELKASCPDFVEIFYNFEDIKQEEFRLLIAVTPGLYDTKIPTLFFRPKCIVVGTGAQKGILLNAFDAELQEQFKANHLSFASLKSINSIDVKAKEEAYKIFSEAMNLSFQTFTAEELNEKEDEVSFSEAAHREVGAVNVSEASALVASGSNKLLQAKSKHVDANGKHFTLALAMDAAQERKGEIFIVGAGPGAPDLVSVRGQKLLKRADLILYAGSLVPRELTDYGKTSCVIRNSADLTLEEQFDVMKKHYDEGGLVVRLHTGDPCIYGAIQEQMNFFDQHEMDYEIVPGISSFQAAAARLKSQFTIPEKVQSIILTRGEGRTPMPPREQLAEFAKFQSTICLFLSVTLVEKLQKDLLEGYPEDTPVAICHKLTWKEEKIWRGELKDLVKIVKENKLSLTVMIVVGEAIGNRKNRSLLYHPKFTHGCRVASEKE